MRSPKYLPLLAVLVLGFLISTPNIADAATGWSGEPIQVFGIAQQDLNGDAQPDVTLIDCAFATAHDRVLVYDQDGDMPVGGQWEQVTDFQDDVWVFDAGADGSAQLIVDFNVEGSKYTALIYDDIDSDGQVGYAVDGKQVTIEESPFWHIKAESELAWEQQAGLPEPGVTILIDGYDGLRYGVGGGLGFDNKGIDGTVDWQVEIGDKNEDGVGDYALARAVNPILVESSRAGFHKTAIFAQEASRQLTPYADTVFWPILVGKHNYEEYRYFDHPSAIAVDWGAGVIDQVGVLGYPIEAGYHIFSRLPLEKNTINEANFENPMAYYDMALDQDGLPELQVRFDYAVANDPYFPSYFYAGTIETPNLEVCYSWDQDNDNRWDYKMELGANYPIDEVVAFPDFTVNSVPYDQIVPWVKDRTWDVAMLVFDQNPSPDSEGMYGKGWHIDRGYVDGKNVEPSGVKSQYLVGLSDQPPFENYQDIQQGMRGEYSFQYFDTPRMYLGALDRQLHLYGAQAGVWNLGAGQTLRYANLDGDAYLDQWQEERDGSVVQQLNYTNGNLVYSGDGGVLLQHTNASPALFESPPPGNYEEWQRLDESLKANQAAFSPPDFTGMLDQLPGAQMQIQGATLRDFRASPQGFRFLLALPPGFKIAGPDWLGLPGKPPGDYIVTYDGEYQVAPAAPPELQFAAPLHISPDEPITAYAPRHVQVTIANQGQQDAPQVRVILGMTGPGQEIAWTEPQTVTVLAGETTPVLFTWAPASPGEWSLLAQARLLSPNTAETKSVVVERVVEVQPAEQTSISQELSAFGLVQPWQLAGLVLALALAAALTVWAFSRFHSETSGGRDQPLG